MGMFLLRIGELFCTMNTRDKVCVLTGDAERVSSETKGVLLLGMWKECCYWECMRRLQETKGCVSECIQGTRGMFSLGTLKVNARD